MHDLLGGRDDVIDSEVKERENLFARGRLAEGVDADHGAFGAHVLPPEVRDARFDRDARNARR